MECKTNKETGRLMNSLNVAAKNENCNSVVSVGAVVPLRKCFTFVLALLS